MTANASSFPRVSCCKRSLSGTFWSSPHSRRRAPLRLTASLIDGPLPKVAQPTKSIHLSHRRQILGFRKSQRLDERCLVALGIASTQRHPFPDVYQMNGQKRSAFSKAYLDKVAQHCRNQESGGANRFICQPFSNLKALVSRGVCGGALRLLQISDFTNQRA